MIVLFDKPRIKEWLTKVFGPDATEDVEERALRFGEEAIELIEALGLSQYQVENLVAQVYGKGEPGDVNQELGGVLVTLSSLCAVADLDADRAGKTEWRRCERPEVIEKIKDKHARKLVVSSNHRSRYGRAD